MSTVVSHVIASKMNPSDSEASMVGSMLNTMLLTNCPGECTTASSVNSRPWPEPRVRAMLDYALALTRRPATMTEDDVVALREAGWSDEDVMDIAEVTGLFNMSNRMASGLGWAPNPEYESLGR